MRDAGGGYHVAGTGGAYLNVASYNLRRGLVRRPSPAGYQFLRPIRGLGSGTWRHAKIGSTGLTNCARDPIGNQVTLAEQEADARPVSGGCCNRAATGLA